MGEGPAIVDQPNAIRSIRATATYELVLEQIRRAIYLGRFLPGDRLPHERDLAAQMGVSRTTIREAVRVLEGEGLLTVRRGATGGLTVLGPPKLGKAQAEAYLETQRAYIDNVFEFRIAIECTTAALAAVRRTDLDLKRLARPVAEMEEICSTPQSRGTTANIARFTARDSEFHLGIARASGNPLLLQAVEDSRAAMFLPVGSVFTRLEDSANDHHRELLEAIEKRDAARASESMRAHIDATRASLHALLPKKGKRSAKPASSAR